MQIDQDDVTITLSRAEAVVLFDMLGREIEDRNAAALRAASGHDAEIWALNNLFCVLQATLWEPYSGKFAAIADAARDTLSQRCGGAWPWPSAQEGQE